MPTTAQLALTRLNQARREALFASGPGGRLDGHDAAKGPVAA